MPTRELAMLANKLIQSLGQYVDNLSAHAIVGGTSIRNDIQTLTKGVHILCSTPGRGKDMLHRGFLKLDHLQLFVIDEAKEIFIRGFKEIIYEIMGYIPQQTQVTMFIGYSNEEAINIKKFNDTYLSNAVAIHQQKESFSLNTIKQYYINVHEEGRKLNTLKDLLQHLEQDKKVIFVNTRRKVEWIMNQNGFKDDNDFLGMHYDMTSYERMLIINKWREKKRGSLLITDLMATGIGSDFEDCKWIINYDLPMNRENYIHRVEGYKECDSTPVIINLVCNESQDQLKSIEAFYNTSIEPLPMDLVV